MKNAKKIIYILLFSCLFQACSSAKLTPEEQQEYREGRAQLQNARMARF